MILATNVELAAVSQRQRVETTRTPTFKMKAPYRDSSCKAVPGFDCLLIGKLGTPRTEISNKQSLTPMALQKSRVSVELLSFLSR